MIKLAEDPTEQKKVVIPAQPTAASQVTSDAAPVEPPPEMPALPDPLDYATLSQDEVKPSPQAAVVPKKKNDIPFWTKAKWHAKRIFKDIGYAKGAERPDGTAYTTDPIGDQMGAITPAMTSKQYKNMQATKALLKIYRQRSELWNKQQNRLVDIGPFELLRTAPDEATKNEIYYNNPILIRGFKKLQSTLTGLSQEEQDNKIIEWWDLNDKAYKQGVAAASPQGAFQSDEAYQARTDKLYQYAKTLPEDQREAFKYGLNSKLHRLNVAHVGDLYQANSMANQYFNGVGFNARPGGRGLGDRITGVTTEQYFDPNLILSSNANPELMLYGGMGMNTLGQLSSAYLLRTAGKNIPGVNRIYNALNHQSDYGTRLKNGVQVGLNHGKGFATPFHAGLWDKAHRLDTLTTAGKNFANGVLLQNVTQALLGTTRAMKPYYAYNGQKPDGVKGYLTAIGQTPAAMHPLNLDTDSTVYNTLGAASNVLYPGLFKAHPALAFILDSGVDLGTVTTYDYARNNPNPVIQAVAGNNIVKNPYGNAKKFVETRTRDLTAYSKKTPQQQSQVASDLYTTQYKKAQHDAFYYVRNNLNLDPRTDQGKAKIQQLTHTNYFNNTKKTTEDTGILDRGVLQAFSPQEQNEIFQSYFKGIAKFQLLNDNTQDYTQLMILKSKIQARAAQLKQQNPRLTDQQCYENVTTDIWLNEKGGKQVILKNTAPGTPIGDVLIKRTGASGYKFEKPGDAGKFSQYINKDTQRAWEIAYVRGMVQAVQDDPNNLKKALPLLEKLASKGMGKFKQDPQLLQTCLSGLQGIDHDKISKMKTKDIKSIVKQLMIVTRSGKYNDLPEQTKDRLTEVSKKVKDTVVKTMLARGEYRELIALGGQYYDSDLLRFIGTEAGFNTAVAAVLLGGVSIFASLLTDDDQQDDEDEQQKEVKDFKKRQKEYINAKTFAQLMA